MMDETFEKMVEQMDEPCDPVRHVRVCLKCSREVSHESAGLWVDGWALCPDCERAARRMTNWVNAVR